MLRLATPNDLDAIFLIIKFAQKRMKQAGITQWQNNYPNITILSYDINNQELYVYVIYQEIIGTMSVFDFDPVYNQIDGQWLNNKPYKVIHRMAVATNYLGQKIAGQMIQLLFNHFNICDIRIDTHPKNLPMIKMLEKQGFQYCGIVYVTTDEDALRLAYHKHITF